MSATPRSSPDTVIVPLAKRVAPVNPGCTTRGFYVESTLLQEPPSPRRSQKEASPAWSVAAVRPAEQASTLSLLER